MKEAIFFFLKKNDSRWKQCSRIRGKVSERTIRPVILGIGATVAGITISNAMKSAPASSSICHWPCSGPRCPAMRRLRPRIWAARCSTLRFLGKWPVSFSWRDGWIAVDDSSRRRNTTIPYYRPAKPMPAPSTRMAAFMMMRAPFPITLDTSLTTHSACSLGHIDDPRCMCSNTSRTMGGSL